MHLHWIDWTIVAAGFLFYLAWAIYLNRKCRSVADYLVSGRKVRMWLGMGAGIAGEMGLISIAAMCEQGYQHGYSFVLINILSLVITVPLFGVFGFGIERFRATRCMSVPQYIEMRFSKNLRIVVGIVNCFAGVLQMCIFPIGGAIFLRQLLGAPTYTTARRLLLPHGHSDHGRAACVPANFHDPRRIPDADRDQFFPRRFRNLHHDWLLVHVVSHAQQPPDFSAGLQTTWTGLESNLQQAGVNPFADNPDAYGIQWFLFLNVMTILLQFSYGPYLQQYASMDRPKTVSRSYLLGGVFGFGRSLIVFGLGVATVAAIGKISAFARAILLKPNG